MPIKYVCSRCHKIIVETERPLPTEVIARKLKRCPHCGKELSTGPKEIEIKTMRK